MKTLFKNKFVLVILCLSFLSVVGVGVNMITVYFQQEGAGDALTTTTGGLVDNGLYDIPTNPTKYQQGLYKDLSEKLSTYTYVSENRDMEKEMEVVGLVVKNFVADFYTWTNKSSNYSVGGSQFMFSDLYLLFQQVARDTYYSDLDGYIAQYGRDNIVEVDSIVTDVAYSGGYSHNGMSYDAYYVQATWTYKECSLDTTGWQNSSAFHVIYHPETGKWEIAQFWNMG